MASLNSPDSDDGGPWSRASILYDSWASTAVGSSARASTITRLQRMSIPWVRFDEGMAGTRERARRGSDRAGRRRPEHLARSEGEVADEAAAAVRVVPGVVQA